MFVLCTILLLSMLEIFHEKKEKNIGRDNVLVVMTSLPRDEHITDGRF